mmetsp:Transcript_21851/g.75125  ORF Transcript_21851/g.75125 Transcript_21851/m.75125 type:complete len:388 (-) Transcript_21851:244-1407(-)
MAPARPRKNDRIVRNASGCRVHDSSMAESERMACSPRSEACSMGMTTSSAYGTSMRSSCFSGAPASRPRGWPWFGPSTLLPRARTAPRAGGAERPREPGRRMARAILERKNDEKSSARARCRSVVASMPSPRENSATTDLRRKYRFMRRRTISESVRSCVTNHPERGKNGWPWMTMTPAQPVERLNWPSMTTPMPMTTRTTRGKSCAAFTRCRRPRTRGAVSTEKAASISTASPDRSASMMCGRLSTVLLGASPGYGVRAPAAPADPESKMPDSSSAARRTPCRAANAKSARALASRREMASSAARTRAAASSSFSMARSDSFFLRCSSSKTSWFSFLSSFVISATSLIDASSSALAADAEMRPSSPSDRWLLLASSCAARATVVAE